MALPPFASRHRVSRLTHTGRNLKPDSRCPKKNAVQEPPVLPDTLVMRSRLNIVNRVHALPWPRGDRSRLDFPTSTSLVFARLPRDSSPHYSRATVRVRARYSRQPTHSSNPRSKRGPIWARQSGGALAQRHAGAVVSVDNGGPQDGCRTQGERNASLVLKRRKIVAADDVIRGLIEARIADDRARPGDEDA